jgi:DNA-binding NarL/FixJ family response regulator
MSRDTALIEAREAFAGRAWSTAYERLLSLGVAGLDCEDLGLLASAAYLVGDRSTATEALERSFSEHVRAGRVRPAALDAHWIGYIHNVHGNHAVGGGWVARAMRLLDTEPADVRERAYLRIHEMIRHIFAGEFSTALEHAELISAAGRQWHDSDLVAFGLATRGRLLLHLGRVPEGLRLLDEAMACVSEGDVTPILTGEILCLMIEGCQAISDFRRITEWTRALTAWCETQPDLVPFTGQCAVHRAQVMRAHADYGGALAELDLAYERYAADGYPQATGLAFYERGEVLRLQGDLDGADAAFAAALAHGHDAQPGQARLWLARGRTVAAVAAMRRLLGEAADPVARCQVLPAAVEVFLAAHDLDSARTASAELGDLATGFRCEAVSADAAYAAGTVLLADGQPAEALPRLRQAWRLWTDLGARYEAAQARARIALAFRALGDEDSAVADLVVAGRTFAELGAVAAQREVSQLAERTLPDGLTAREVEVLRLVASGRTNPEIAQTMFLSHKTVQRHLSNIFGKTGVTSRTAAAAYAFEHHLA